MKHRNNRDTFADGLCLGFDDGDIRGEWNKKPSRDEPGEGDASQAVSIIPKTPEIIEGSERLAVDNIIPLFPIPDNIVHLEWYGTT